LLVDGESYFAALHQSHKVQARYTFIFLCRDIELAGHATGFACEKNNGLPAELAFNHAVLEQKPE